MSGTKGKIAVFYAILAAVFYAVNIPCSKLLLKDVSPMMMAAFLYFGAGLGMSALYLFRKKCVREVSEQKLERKDLPYTVSMVLLDVAAPICLMFGITKTQAANASLLNNFEIVATALVAMLFFKERVSVRLWIAIVLITVACILLSFEGKGAFLFSTGSILILIACVCWGLENNCTRSIAHKDPMQIVIIKGFGSGFGSFLIAMCASEPLPFLRYVFFVLLLGSVSYGLSIYFYTLAQRTIGAAKTSAFYAVAPFVGVVFSFLFLGECPNYFFWIALVIMAVGSYLAARNN